MATTNATSPLSVFEHNGDVGAVHLPGGAYFGEDGLVVTGSGHNMWLDRDEFHFVWREVEGDWSLSTTAHFRGDGVGAHRKAVVLVRQDLGTSAVYAGIALHGDGLTSLQYRSKVGALTEEIRFSSNAPTRLGVRKVGDRVEAAASGESHAVQLALTGRYYIGVAVCSHVDDVLETVDFSEVKLSPLV
jgi:TolB protein